MATKKTPKKKVPPKKKPAPKKKVAVKRKPKAKVTPKSKLKVPNKTGNSIKSLMPVPDPVGLRSNLKKQMWLDAYAICGTVTGAAKLAGISFVSYYAWSNPKYYDGQFYDEEFTKVIPMYYELYSDRLRSEIDRRAIDGWDEPVFGSVGYKEGRETAIVGHVRKFSDRLLELRSKMVLPEAKNTVPNVNVDNRSVKINGSDKEVEAFKPEDMTRDQRVLMRQFIEMGQTKDQETIEGEVIDAKAENS